MRVLKQGLNRFDKWTQGYFYIKNNVAENIQREVLLTVYDIEKDLSCFGYLFLSRDKVLLILTRDLSDGQGIYELDNGDKLEIVESGENLKNILNSQIGGETYLRVRTKNPICFVKLNEKYLLVLNIQTHLKYGYFLKGAMGVTYLTGSDYVEKAKTLLDLIDDIINGRAADFTKKLPGMSAPIMKLNFFLMPIGFFIPVLMILLTLLGLL